MLRTPAGSHPDLPAHDPPAHDPPIPGQPAPDPRARRQRRMQGRRLPAILAAGLVALVVSACVPAAEVGAPTMLLGNWVNGSAHVWDFAFAPVWVPPIYTDTDSGIIFARFSDNEPARALGQVSTFDSFDPTGEGGLMGIAFDPGYNAGANRRVYVCYSTPTDNRVARFDLDEFAAPGARITNWTPIVTGIPHNSFHDGCRVRFQPGTGALFVSTGDAGSATAPQDPASLGGKILRIDTDGHAWPGNVSGALWYTRGHRNPQGIAFRPGSNDPYSIEHGPDRNDEVNKLINGGNGGWNPNDGAGNYDQSQPMTNPSLPGPVMNAVWRSGDGGTVAPSGGTFLTGAQWRAWNGALAVAELKGSQLMVLKVTADGTALSQFPVTTLARNTRLRSAVEGPDGNLYVATDGGVIWKVVPL